MSLTVVIEHRKLILYLKQFLSCKYFKDTLVYEGFEKGFSEFRYLNPLLGGLIFTAGKHPSLQKAREQLSASCFC